MHYNKYNYSKNFYSAGILGVAKFKALQAKKHKTENICPEEAVFVIKRSGSQLTKEDSLRQKCEFLDVAENKSGIQRSEYTGEVCSRHKVHRR